MSKIGDYFWDRLTNTTDRDNDLGPILWAVIISGCVALVVSLIAVKSGEWPG